MSNNKFKAKKKVIKFKTTSLANKDVEQGTVDEQKEPISKKNLEQDDILNKPIKNQVEEEPSEGKTSEEETMFNLDKKGLDNLKPEVTPISTKKLSESASVIDNDSVKKPRSILFIFYLFFQVLVIVFLGWMIYQGLVSIEAL